MFSDDIVNILKKQTILFVDDETHITDMFCDLFKKGLGIVSHCAYDGKDGLKKFKKYRDTLIIADIEMPKLNGHQMVKKIFSIDSEVKVIFLSGYSDRFYHKSLAKYINNIVYIEKPISTQKLQDALERLYV